MTRPRTDVERSRDRYQRAARTLGGITLDQQLDDALKAILATTGETAVDWVRRMIREQAPRDSA